MPNPAYDALLNAQQATNLRALESIAEAGIEFAYPTQTLFVKR